LRENDENDESFAGSAPAATATGVFPPGVGTTVGSEPVVSSVEVVDAAVDDEPPR
jgi:hypothetical protein